MHCRKLDSLVYISVAGSHFNYRDVIGSQMSPIREKSQNNKAVQGHLMSPFLVPVEYLRLSMCE